MKRESGFTIRQFGMNLIASATSLGRQRTRLHSCNLTAQIEAPAYVRPGSFCQQVSP